MPSVKSDIESIMKWYKKERTKWAHGYDGEQIEISKFDPIEFVGDWIKLKSNKQPAISHVH